MTSADSQDLLLSNPHWAAQYIGRPWVNGGQGPDSFDCWGFFRHVQANHYGIDTPLINIDADNYRAVINGFKGHAELQHWPQVNQPQDGDAVLLRHAKYPSHVGVWLDIDGGGVLHCVRGEGVVFSTLTALGFSGWGKIEYHRHASNA